MQALSTARPWRALTAVALAAASATITACADTVTAPRAAHTRPALELSGDSTRSGAPSREWTVMVFMAADNSLAVQGVGDIDEMEAAGASPEVQVVVQAEFSPTEFARAGCGQPSCAHLPSFNTFRYAITGGARSVTGPDGQVTDIGDRNMTDPAQIAEFVRWAKDRYPAKHYALVLWNHGGGYAGLLEDLTTAGSHLMSIGELPAALSDVGPIDVLDFDMCLMAGYETLTEVAPFARYVVFSEETEPGEGDPYTGMLTALRAQPTADGRAVAGMFVDEWAKFYDKHRASTTKSAYDMAGFAQFTSALDAAAERLAAAVGDADGSAAVHDAAARAQRFDIKPLADIGTFVDALRERAADPALASTLGALRESLESPVFLVRNTARKGSASNARDVSRATGLHALLPSGGTDDALPDGGPLSFAEYRRLLPERAWTRFLTAYLEGGTGAPTTSALDQGEQRFESYVVWDSASTSRGVDIDMWILEPDGGLYIPFLGTVSPNGHLTPVSYDGGVSYEGYLTNRFVLRGRYYVVANLYADPADVRPRFDVQYRFDQQREFSSLYSPRFPRLSLQRSWLDDEDLTFEKLENGAYTDLQIAAWVDLGVESNALAATRTLNAPDAAMRGAMRGAVRLTAPQLQTVRRNLMARSAMRNAARMRAPNGAPAHALGLRPLAGP